MLNLFGASNPIKVVGVRAGEKLHEILVSAEELTRAADCGDYYRVHCHGEQDYDEYFVRGIFSDQVAREGYTSENAPQLTVAETEQLLLQLPEIRQDLDQWTPGVISLRRAA